MTHLLVSVRSPDEAEAALAGGADLIDVKEPARGPLGRADDAAVAAILRAVAGQRPVSAALGELRDPSPPPVRGVAFAKWGLSGLGADPRWQLRLEEAAGATGASPVAVAYADHVLANSPAPAAVADFARSRHWPVLLLDTFTKDGRTLLDFWGPGELVALCRRCRSGGVRVALAGSLRLEHMALLRGLEPDWLAVRSAACAGGQRDQAICVERVRALAANLRPASYPLG